MKQLLKIDKMYKLFGKSEHICKECKHFKKIDTAARDDVSRAEDKDSELKMLKKNNRALTDYCNALLDENRRLARSIGREKP